MFPAADYGCPPRCGKRATESAPEPRHWVGKAWGGARDLSIIIDTSWVAPNQTRGLIEAHFRKRGERERETEEMAGRW